VKNQPATQETVNDPVIPPESFPPQEERVQHANAVNGDGNAEIGFVRPIQK